jgi:hypothetical protein
MRGGIAELTGLCQDAPLFASDYYPHVKFPRRVWDIIKQSPCAFPSCQSKVRLPVCCHELRRSFAPNTLISRRQAPPGSLKLPASSLPFHKNTRSPLGSGREGTRRSYRFMFGVNRHTSKNPLPDTYYLCTAPV